MTTLYRLIDAKGQLLYVGIADHWPCRMKEHSAEKEWWGDVAHVRLEQFSDREAALAAERTAIKSEHPRHNVVHNSGVPLPAAKLKPSDLFIVRPDKQEWLGDWCRHCADDLDLDDPRRLPIALDVDWRRQNVEAAYWCRVCGNRWSCWWSTELLTVRHGDELILAGDVL